MADLEALEKLTEALVLNAEDLLNAVKGTFTPEEVKALQERQRAIISDISDLDAQLSTESQKGAPWNRLCKNLERFEELNAKFIENVQVRKGLIEVELQEVKQSQRQVKGLKASYGNQKPKKKSRINTIT